MFVAANTSVGEQVHPESLRGASVAAEIFGFGFSLFDLRPGTEEGPRVTRLGFGFGGLGGLDGIGCPMSTIVVLLGDFVRRNLECLRQARIYVRYLSRVLRAVGQSTLAQSKWTYDNIPDIHP